MSFCAESTYKAPQTLDEYRTGACHPKYTRSLAKRRESALSHARPCPANSEQGHKPGFCFGESWDSLTPTTVRCFRTKPYARTGKMSCIQRCHFGAGVAFHQKAHLRGGLWES